MPFEQRYAPVARDYAMQVLQIWLIPNNDILHGRIQWIHDQDMKVPCALSWSAT